MCALAMVAMLRMAAAREAEMSCILKVLFGVFGLCSFLLLTDAENGTINVVNEVSGRERQKVCFVVFSYQKKTKHFVLVIYLRVACK